MSTSSLAMASAQYLPAGVSTNLHANSLPLWVSAYSGLATLENVGMKWRQYEANDLNSLTFIGVAHHLGRFVVLLIAPMLQSVQGYFQETEDITQHSTPSLSRVQQGMCTRLKHQA